ncbi:MAG: response regulator [Myxococcaceae bacterium]
MSAALKTVVPESRRIVIVEDEGILALDIERHLRSRGFDVVGVAADSQSALSLIEETRPDLVLMDIRIQGDVDGIETARAIGDRFDLPVVYLTAHSDPGTIERAQRTAPLGYLVKPFKKPDLENVVGIALRRARLERSLRQREAELRSTLECLDEAVFAVGEDAEIQFANPAASALLGLKAEQLEGRPLTDLVPAVAASLDEARHAGRAALTTTLDRNGQRTLIGTVARMHEQSLVVALRDLTELLTARRQAELADRLSTLGSLAAGVAHEVNNPLAVVVSNLSYLGQDAVLSPDGREALQEAQEATQRVSRLVGELLTFTSPQHEVFETSTAAAGVRSALRLTRSQWKSVDVSLVLDDAPPITISPPRLSQVLVGLVINACQALEDERSPRALQLQVGATSSGSALIQVMDSGPGVQEQLRTRIFEPFFTTKPGGKGTGLGLAIANNLVARMGGELRCVSRPDGARGACFAIELPRSNAPLELALKVAWVGEEKPLLAELRSVCEVEQLSAEAARGSSAAVIIVSSPLPSGELDRLGPTVLRLPGVPGAGPVLQRATARGLLAFAGKAVG